MFFIQRAQINASKEVNSSMKAFVDIFRVDDVKKYVELKNEANRLELDTAIRKTLANNANQEFEFG